MRADAGYDLSRERMSVNAGPLESRFRGASLAAERVRALIDRAARVNGTVLVTGESGVGKELVAREIHARSTRRDRPFIPVNCAAIADTLIESELFGHEAGAFTDARETRRGAFELADGGTLFLDEIGDLSAHAQPKALRAIENAEFTRVGGERLRRADIRLIAATNHDLRRMCREGRFREDLYYRLCIIRIHVPPLRDRREDVTELAEYFARMLAERTGRPFHRISRAALGVLAEHSWPGNVRELRAMVERALAMNSGIVLDESCFTLESGLSGASGVTRLLGSDWREARRGFEAMYARDLLRRHGGNVPRAARAAGLAPRSLYKMLRRLGLRRGPDSS